MTSPFSGRGAIDLAALAAAREAQAKAAARAQERAAQPDGAVPVVIDVTDQTFRELVEQSMTVPVVLDLWATWCGPCKQLSPILERLAESYTGRFLLAKVDVDASPGIAQAFQVQSIPSVFGIVAGQPVPLFQGALPEPQVAQFIDELLRVAAANGVSGTVSGGAPGAAAAPGQAASAETPEEQVDPRFDKAFEAVEAGDWEAAEAAYRAVLAETPADEVAKAGLAQVGLLKRTDGRDPQEVVAAADADPSDAEAVRLAADVLVMVNRPVEAFARLVGLIRFSAGDEREAARKHLLELFEVVGSDDPAVARARIDLANALF